MLKYVSSGQFIKGAAALISLTFLGSFSYSQEKMEMVAYFPTPYAQYSSIQTNQVDIGKAKTASKIQGSNFTIATFDIKKNLNANRASALTAESVSVVDGATTSGGVINVSGETRFKRALESAGNTSGTASYFVNTVQLGGKTFPYVKAIDPDLSIMEWRSISYKPDASSAANTKTFLALKEACQEGYYSNSSSATQDTCDGDTEKMYFCGSEIKESCTDVFKDPSKESTYKAELVDVGVMVDCHYSVLSKECDGSGRDLADCSKGNFNYEYSSGSPVTNSRTSACSPQSYEYYKGGSLIHSPPTSTAEARYLFWQGGTFVGREIASSYTPLVFYETGPVTIPYSGGGSEKQAWLDMLGYKYEKSHYAYSIHQSDPHGHPYYVGGMPTCPAGKTPENICDSACVGVDCNYKCIWSKTVPGCPAERYQYDRTRYSCQNSAGTGKVLLCSDRSSGSSGKTEVRTVNCCGGKTNCGSGFYKASLNGLCCPDGKVLSLDESGDEYCTKTCSDSEYLSRELDICCKLDEKAVKKNGVAVCEPSPCGTAGYNMTAGGFCCEQGKVGAVINGTNTCIPAFNTMAIKAVIVPNSFSAKSRQVAMMFDHPLPEGTEVYVKYRWRYKSYYDDLWGTTSTSYAGPYTNEITLKASDVNGKFAGGKNGGGIVRVFPSMDSEFRVLMYATILEFRVKNSYGVQYTSVSLPDTEYRDLF